MKKLFLVFLLTCFTLSAQISQPPQPPTENGAARDDSVFDLKVSTYSHPGLVSLKNNEGSDNLYNLTSRIYVKVEIETLQGQVNDISATRLEQLIGERFRQAHIEPFVPSFGGDLPLFHVLIMINPINRGYAVSVEGRLFESVTLSRVRLASQTAFQAITWESQSLIVTPTDDVVTEVIKSVDSIAKLFADRFGYFEDLLIRRNLER